MNHRAIASVLLVYTAQMLLNATASAQDQYYDGNLTVTKGLKAGTSGAKGGLELRLDGLFISKGTNDYWNPGNLLTSDQGAGARLLWYPRKAAFRAGSVSANQWDDSNIGLHSVALGWSTLASAESSFAMGYYAGATGWGAISLGYSTSAIGTSAVALGAYSAASGYASTALGAASTASGVYATAAGDRALASGDSSVAMGSETLAESYATFAVGQRNLGGGSPTTWNPADPIFEIGIGLPDVWDDAMENLITPGTRANALTVYKDGKVTIHKRQGDILMGEFGN